MKVRFVTVILLCGFVLLFAEATVACVGARPLAMGGAFIGVADDINAVYWNPAGLVQLEQAEITWTRTLNHRNIINYDDFFAVGTYNAELGLAYAVGYINITDYYPIGYFEGDFIYLERIQQWFILSLAKKITPQLSIGGSIRYPGY